MKNFDNIDVFDGMSVPDFLKPLWSENLPVLHVHQDYIRRRLDETSNKIHNQSLMLQCLFEALDEQLQLAELPTQRQSVQAASSTTHGYIAWAKDLFTDQWKKSSATLSLIGPEIALSHNRTALELIFSNIVGKALFRSPKGSCVNIQVTQITPSGNLEHEKGVEIMVWDQGPQLSTRGEELVVKASPYFLPEDQFQKECKVYGIAHEQSHQLSKGNRVLLRLPLPCKE